MAKKHNNSKLVGCVIKLQEYAIPPNCFSINFLLSLQFEQKKARTYMTKVCSFVHTHLHETTTDDRHKKMNFQMQRKDNHQNRLSIHSNFVTKHIKCCEHFFVLVVLLLHYFFCHHQEPNKHFGI